MKNDIAIITGGTSGIGFAIAELLCEKYDLALIFKNNESRAQTAVEYLQGKTSKRVFSYRCDIANLSEVDDTYKRIKKDLSGFPSVLVNSAGVSNRSLFLQEEAETIKQVIDTNLLGPMQISRVVLGDMYKSKIGKIIFLSSIASSGGYVGLSVYGAAKAGLDSFVKSLCSEVGHRNIQVNTIRPGLVCSNMTQKIADSPNLHMVNMPLGRLIEAHEVAKMALFLIDDPVGLSINGADFTIDGGASTYRNQLKVSQLNGEV